MTAPGSVATILSTCPLLISAKYFLVRKMGNGQTRPRASNSLSKFICFLFYLYGYFSALLLPFSMLRNSSLVKALLNKYTNDGLRLTEVEKHHLIDVVEKIYQRLERFILYCDGFDV